MIDPPLIYEHNTQALLDSYQIYAKGAYLDYTSKISLPFTQKT